MTSSATQTRWPDVTQQQIWRTFLLGSTRLFWVGDAAYAPPGPP